MAVAYFPTAIKQYKYGKGPIPFRSQDWKDFDFPVIKSFIECCLDIDPHKRITAKDALNHEWFEVN
jgi:serine/threonine protein kinase